MTSAGETGDVLSFGPFSLIASQRLLTRDGAPVELGGRSLDILIALVSSPNEVVSKHDLLARVWPDVTVEEGSLRFHMAGLRKALGDGKDGARYITTLAGRGYCFVAPVARTIAAGNGQAKPAADFPHANLPNRLSRMVGRADDVLALSRLLVSARFVTIVGAGGIGKTTVAVAVAHELFGTFAGAALFVDLGMLGDPGLAATAVASMLGLSVRSDDATPSLIAYLRDKRILLIFDTCEHLIDAVAALAARIVQEAPQIHVLATSREALQVDGEHVYKLDPLGCPPDYPGITAAAAQTFPATELFMARAAASGARRELTDRDAEIVASICRRLDGMPLAIELAARRVEAYGLEQTAALLDQRLTLLWPGPRSAPARQKTLQATLDWSYGLLSEQERVVLRRLAVFVGHFAMDAALAVVTSAEVDRAVVFGAIDSLVAKSMVATRPVGATVRYRLLDTTRAYALGISLTDSEAAELSARHATHYRQWLEQSGADWPRHSDGTQRAPYFAGLNNVRVALEWCFGPTGDREIGIGLAAAAAPVFLAMSLLPECQRWSERALHALDAATRGGPEEMHLQAALGVASMFTRGNSEAARTALERSLAIAEQHGNAPGQLQMLSLLHMFHQRIGDFKATLHYARRSGVVAGTIAIPSAVALAHCLLGSTLHHMGELAEARAEIEAALQTGPGHQRATTINLDFEHYNYAGVALARTLWLQGLPAQAMERARTSVMDAESMGHPVPLCRALVWAISVFLWAGDLASADRHTDLLVSHAEAHALGPYAAVGRGYQGASRIRRGDARGGVESLQQCRAVLQAARYALLTTAFNIALAEGLAALGRDAEALALIDETIRLVDENGELSHMPELLRVRAGILLAMPKPDSDDAAACLMQSLEMSRRQGARGWELRAAIDLAKLAVAQGKSADACALLQPVFAQFTEGYETADLQAAERLLATLSTAAPPPR